MNGVDPEIVDTIEHTAAVVPGVASVRDVQVRWEGHRLRADLALGVTATLTVADAHDLAHTVEHELLHHVAHLDGAAVHVEPDGPERDSTHTITEHHR